MAETEAPQEEVQEPVEPDPIWMNPHNQRVAPIQSHQIKVGNSGWTAPREVHGGHIVADAVNQIGQPFSYGGTQPGGFDSHGLAKYAYQQNGIPMSYLVHNQMQHGENVAPSELAPGDLVFVATGNPQIADRTGVYVGGGVMVHAAPGAGVVASRVSHVGRIVGGVHLRSVVRHSTPKPEPIPPGLYETDDVMPHNRLSPELKESVTNIKGVH